MVLMLTILASPVLAKKLLTTSSNLSCPTSMQSVWRMVLVRIFFSASLTAAESRGASGFSMRLSVVLWTGTRKCISIFLAADEAMGLMGWAASARGPAESAGGLGGALGC